MEQACPKCGAELPILKEDGSHNFCPSSRYFPGKIVEICMRCKMEEVVKKWREK